MLKLFEKVFNFGIDFGNDFLSILHQKSTQNRSKNQPKSDVIFDLILKSIFGGSWMEFGVDLEAKLGPSWNQNRSKIHQK